jgi:imidazolonepropionase-like amidohydrolase
MNPQTSLAETARLILTNARVMDGTGAPPRDGQTVLVENGRISAVGEAGQVRPPEGATSIDLKGRTLLPSLIDAHVHLSGLYVHRPGSQGQPISPEIQAYGLVHECRAILAGGITMMRDAGSYGRSLFNLRQAMNLGLCDGPRLVLCGQIVAATSPGGRAFAGMYREADGPDDMRKAVREQIRQGADYIKIMSTGALTVADEDVNPAQMTAEELAAIVDEAHRMGRKVASHAEGLAGIQLSVAAGADTIEHGEMAHQDPAVLDAMAAQGIILVPTVWLFERMVNDEVRWLPWMRERAKMLGENSHKTVQAARRAGVLMAMGADGGPAGQSASELIAMVEAGLTPMEGIVAATSLAARACGVEADFGSVQAGKVADLLVLDADPLANLKTFLEPEKIWLVLQGGRAVAGTATRAIL